MTELRKLPVGFGELEPFVAIWAKPTVDERVAARGVCSMEEIRAFYEAMIGRGDEILNYLGQYGLCEMPEDAAVLLQLLLGLVQASVAVEIQRQPNPSKTTFPLKVSMISGAEPFGAIKR